MPFRRHGSALNERAWRGSLAAQTWAGRPALEGVQELEAKPFTASRARELASLEPSQLHELFATRQVSPVEVMKATIALAETEGRTLNAWAVLDGEAGLLAAQESEARWLRGAPLSHLDGVPVSVKDNLPVAGWPTRLGSRLTSPKGPWTIDAPAAARLREAGAVLYAKTTTSEFCFKAVGHSPLHGLVRNPHDLARTSGGSSAGAAASIGAGIGSVAVATDGAGSIRIPASFCGAVGVKPTFGTIPTYPYNGFSSYSHVGAIATSVTAAAQLLEVIAHPDVRDWLALPTRTGAFEVPLSADVKGVRVALCPSLNGCRAEPEVENVLRLAAGALAQAGAEITEAEPPLEYGYDLFELLWSAICAYTLRDLDDEAISHVDPLLQTLAERGQTLRASELLRLEQARMVDGAALQQFHSRFDLILLPVAPSPAFAVGRDWPEPDDRWEVGRWMGFTYPFNLSQQPAVSVPFGSSSGGAPIGVQLVGPKYADRNVLRAAAVLESTRPTSLQYGSAP